jgi:hypothetical protein
MRAVQIDHAYPTNAIAEKHEIFTEQTRTHWATFGLYVFRKSHRPPIASKHFARGRAGANASDPFVIFFGQHEKCLYLWNVPTVPAVPMVPIVSTGRIADGWNCWNNWNGWNLL